MKLTDRDHSRLSGVNSQLQAVVFKAAERTSQPFMVVEGKRTQARQDELYAQGRTKPGKIVTWTRNSRHIDGDAVDIAPLAADGSIPWTDFPSFDRVAQAMFAAADELGVDIRWGADWDQDGLKRERGENDSPHFELA